MLQTVAYSCQFPFQKLSRPTSFHFRHLLRRTRTHYHPTPRAAFRADVHDVVGHFDDVEVVLDDDDAVAVYGFSWDIRDILE